MRKCIHTIFLMVFICLLNTIKIYAQKEHRIIKGIVTDANTNSLIEGVSVQIENLPIGTVTNENGLFSLRIDTTFTDAVLVFSHLSYQINRLKLNNHQNYYTIKLMPKWSNLSEVEITATKKLKPIKIGHERVLDFAITSNRLFVLGWENGKKKPSLQCIDLQTDSLLFSYQLPFYTENLFIDCLENLHFLTENAVYQVYFDKSSFRLYPPTPKIDFESSLVPCLTTLNNKVYFQQKLNKGIIVSFFVVDQDTRETKLLRTIQDNLVLGMQQNEARYQYLRNARETDKEARYVNQDLLNRRAMRNAEFGQKFMFQASYIPLIKIANQICLFDHLNGKIEFYTSDTLSKSLSINYHIEPGWEKQIIVDINRNQVYALFQKRGIYELKLLDLKTGELGKTYTINNQFPSKITVHNDQVYFMYKDPTKNGGQFLYKAPLTSIGN